MVEKSAVLKPRQVGHLHDESFSRRPWGAQVEIGPVIVAGVGQPGVGPVPVLHGVLQPKHLRSEIQNKLLTANASSLKS